jgi:hypothetical protein
MTAPFFLIRARRFERSHVTFYNHKGADNASHHDKNGKMGKMGTPDCPHFKEKWGHPTVPILINLLKKGKMGTPDCPHFNKPSQKNGKMGTVGCPHFTILK